MTFEEALRQLKVGGRVRRESWESGAYLMRGELRTGVGSQQVVPVIFRHSDEYHVDTFEPSSSELFATDWASVGEPPPVMVPSSSVLSGSLLFTVGGQETLRFTPNGDIYVQGRFVENDGEVLEALRALIPGIPPAPPVTGQVRFDRVLRDDDDKSSVVGNSSRDFPKDAT